MLELNRQAQVSVHAQAADIEFTLEPRADGKWSFTIEGVSDISLAAGDSGLSEAQPVERTKQTFALNDRQASATMALFVGELLEDSALNDKLYEIAQEVWKDVPNHFRPIP